MIKINLKPKKERKIKGVPKIKLGGLPQLSLKSQIIYFVPVIFLIGEISYLFYINKQISDLNTQKEELEQKKTKLNAFKKNIDDLLREINEQKKLKEEVNLRIATIENLSNQKKDFSKLLDAVVYSYTDGIWLTSANLSIEKSSLSGFAFSPDYISTYYSNLNRYFDSISFSQTEMKVANAGFPYYSFNFEISSFKGGL
ncbi:hypothetical protein JCM14244_04290 [Venenivibrio stagnispumantis]|uniref:Type IV pilus assembly protein PilN n=1 Tax=Venenivibrio stagnispumantis TaxID=407998 RepID=A0AA45WJW8_9AQUI|nr:hypothetical protein [Venenivibrio stagnispumantis]MCW4572933.1 hypothetical protein [Venenivibrio stagnispumantis]SMP04729.1 hypothetical protein SAMN06264868_10334 [Venenivibrio stagnispumantis]